MQIRKETLYILIAGALLLLVGAFYRYSPGLANGWDIDAEIAREKEKLEKFTALVRERSFHEAHLIKMNRSLERTESGLLTGETPAMAGVDIQNALSSIAGRSGVEIESMYVLTVKEIDESDPYPRVEVEAGFNASVRQLKEILYGIQSSSTLLRVSDATCDIEAAKKTGLLKIRLKVEGFMKKTGSPEDA